MEFRIEKGVVIMEKHAYWMFRSVGLMNLTRDPIARTAPEDIPGAYTQNIRTAMNYAKEMGANFVELAIMLDQSDQLASLLPYYRIVPALARERNLHVYFRGTPRDTHQDALVRAEGDAFRKECQIFFDELEALWTQMDGGFLRDGDVVSTWAEGDMQFTDRLGWEEGTKKYQQYVVLAADFIDSLRRKTGLKLYHTESICGGEGRLKEQFNPQAAQRLDFIAWDHYAGIMNDHESREEMKRAADEMVTLMKKYAAYFGTKLCVGEWSTHWDTPKSKEEQAAYIRILADALEAMEPSEFVGMEYFHYALPGHHLDFDNASTYYASPVIDASGAFPGYEVLRETYLSHSKED